MPLVGDVKSKGIKEPDPRKRGLLLAMAILSARLKGELRTAVMMMASIADYNPERNALMDPSLGSETFLTVQAGITRMLAGDFRGALSDFEKAKWTFPPHDLQFLLRDAHVKSALIYALVGEPGQAISELDASKSIPRTGSWAETLVDSSEQLAQLLIEGTHSANASDALLAMNRRDIGEMWPFYVLALGTSVLAGDHRATHVLSTLGAAELPGSRSREGLPGSAFSLVHSALASRSGQLAKSRGQLENADAGLIFTILSSAGIAIDAADPELAMRLSLGVAASTTGLLQLELWRLSIVFLAHKRLQQSASEESTLARVEQLANELTHFNLAVGGTVGDFILAVMSGNPVPADTMPRITLTPRERAVLIHLAEGLSRRQMSERLFVSTHTIKSQVSSLYKKLGVSNRDSLVSEAIERGLV